MDNDTNTPITHVRVGRDKEKNPFITYETAHENVHGHGNTHYRVLLHIKSNEIQIHRIQKNGALVPAKNGIPDSHLEPISVALLDYAYGHRLPSLFQHSAL